jgi:hypothetical protein
MPTELLTLKGTTGVELQGVYVEFVNANQGPAAANYLFPGSQLIARVELIWQTQAQLMNFLTALTLSDINSSANTIPNKKNQVIISLPNVGIARIAWLAVPYSSVGTNIGTQTLCKKSSLQLQAPNTVTESASPTLKISFPLSNSAGAFNKKLIKLIHCTPIGAGGQISADNFIFVNHATYAFLKIDITDITNN